MVKANLAVDPSALCVMLHAEHSLQPYRVNINEPDGEEDYTCRNFLTCPTGRAGSE